MADPAGRGSGGWDLCGPWVSSIRREKILDSVLARQHSETGTRGRAQSTPVCSRAQEQGRPRRCAVPTTPRKGNPRENVGGVWAPALPACSILTFCSPGLQRHHIAAAQCLSLDCNQTDLCYTRCSVYQPVPSAANPPALAMARESWPAVRCPAFSLRSRAIPCTSSWCCATSCRRTPSSPRELCRGTGPPRVFASSSKSKPSRSSAIHDQKRDSKG